MLELPEALTIARQLRETVVGRRIVSALVGSAPHKFAWYWRDPKDYPERLQGRSIVAVRSWGGIVEVETDEKVMLWFSDGARLRYHGAGEKRPPKHQLLIELDNGGAISASVQMYGGLFCAPNAEMDNPYVLVSRAKPSPLSSGFDEGYFHRLLEGDPVQALSAKAFLATEQRVPGLGNGVLQDILFKARIHPRRKMGSLSRPEVHELFSAVKESLTQMATQGGRDTETDLFGQRGGYTTLLSKNTVDKPCPVCGEFIRKEAYLGGSIYYCPGCQRL